MRLKNKTILVFILIFGLYHLYLIFGSLLVNGLSVFNLNDAGLMNIVIIVNLAISLIGLIFLFTNKANAKLITNLFFGSLILAYLMPYIVYFLGLPSNDFMRIFTIIVVPILIMCWIWSIKTLDN